MSNSLWIEEKDRQGTAYFELQKGKYDGTFWKKDSLLIHCDDFDRTGIGRVLRETSDFDYYGITEIDREIWEDFSAKRMNILTILNSLILRKECVCS